MSVVRTTTRLDRCGLSIHHTGALVHSRILVPWASGRRRSAALVRKCRAKHGKLGGLVQFHCNGAFSSWFRPSSRDMEVENSP